MEIIAIQEEMDVIGITESWTHEGIIDGEISLKGYTMLRRDMKEGDQGERRKLDIVCQGQYWSSKGKRRGK